MLKNDLVSIEDLSAREIREIFALTNKLKQNKAKFNKALTGKTLALVFQKPSNRTRVSFEVGMYQLGGNSIYLAPDEINLGVRESIKDVSQTLSRYVDAIVIRTYAHQNVLEMSRYASVPVINGLSDFSHPCQALADVYTIKERCKNFPGITLAYVGDGNNVCNSLIFTCAKLGLTMHVATPKGYEPAKEARLKNSRIKFFSEPFSAVKGAEIIYTDVWVSMGREKEAEKRIKVFKDFQVNKKLVSLAKQGCLIMHCLPAHRGQEITDEVIDGPCSIVFDQAENRLHVQKAILIKLLKRG